MPGMPRQAPCSSAARSRKFNHLLQGNDGVFGSGAERTITLSAVATDAVTDPFLRHRFAHSIDDARAGAVRNDPRIRHSDTERVFAFLDVAWIYS
jgi:hypothetical protein